MTSFASSVSESCDPASYQTSTLPTHEKAVNAHRLRRQAALPCYSVPPIRRGSKAGLFALLRCLRSVLRPSLLPIFHAARIQGSTDDVVANARQVLDSPAAHQHHRVLLQVVTLTRNVRRNFHLIGKADSGDFAQRRIRFLGRHCLYLGAYAPLLRCIATLALTTGIPTHGCIRESKGWRLCLFLDALSAFTDQLINRWHGQNS